MSTTIEAPRPEAPPYTWPNQDLKNLVQLAPMSPYTRALLRIKFNRPVPDACTTFEQIEAWLATLTPPKRTPALYVDPYANQHLLATQEIERGEYLEILATQEGWDLRKEFWKKRERIKVPLSIWEGGESDVEEYALEYLRDCDHDVYDSDYAGDSEDDGVVIKDFEELMQQAEDMISERDEENED
jgi:hypothetical protein